MYTLLVPMLEKVRLC